MEVVIDRLGHLGDGIAPESGRESGSGPMFVPRALPGETVRGTADGDALRDVKVVTPSPDRVAPPCPHYRSCGGCQLQHARDEFVAGFKQDVVRTALAGQGIDAPLRAIITPPAGTRRRAGFAARRTKAGALVGFHARASDVLVAVPDCRVIDPALRPAMAAAEEFARQGSSRKAELSVRATVTANGPDVVVFGGKPLDGPLRQVLAQIALRHGLSRLAWGEEVVAMQAPPAQRFGRADVVPPPGAFLQATPEGESALRAATLEITQGASRIADLFAGCGTFALPMSERAEVHAVEGDAAMIEALVAGWRRAGGLRALTAETRDLFRRPLLPDELKRFDAVVIDPPRAGAEAQINALARARIPVIAHVSCNPVTFARDARTLCAAGYRLDWVQVVDQFRWSAHVELVGAFRLPHIGRD